MFTEKKLAALSLLCLLGILPACSSEPDTTDDSLTIGLLLPFTGNASATAANLDLCC